MAAKSTKKDPVENKQTTAVAEQPKAEKGEIKYSAADLANAARKRFKVMPEVVQAALKTAGLTEATVSQAQKIISKFLERKVK